MFFAGIVALILAIDLGIKNTIEDMEASAFPKEVEVAGGKIILHKVHNDGFPFGLFRKRPDMVKGIPLVITSALAGMFIWLYPKKGYRTEKLAISLILGGALSNLYDRLIRHYVVDYFSIPCKALNKVVFNLGDIAIFLGTGIWFLLEMIRTLKET